MKVILPKTLHEIDWSYGPLFFFAGPIKGGGDWQRRACAEVEKRLTDYYATIPCRYGDDHSLRKYAASGRGDYFSSQTFWERHYLELAATCRGCIVFWLPCESKTDPRSDGQPYARDTYGEIGEWRGALKFNPNLKVVIGAEQGFPGLEVMKKNFVGALKQDFPFYNTLEETIQAAVAMAK